MARKRVSLKDKGPETLGLTDSKNKGLEVLLGGPAAGGSGLTSKPAASRSKITNQPNAEVINMAAENKDNVTNSTAAVTTPPPPPPLAPLPESLPVNEAGDVTSGVSDDLGLPVAQEFPPAALAAASATPRAVDEFGLPVAMDGPPSDMTMSVLPSPPPLAEAPAPLPLVAVEPGAAPMFTPAPTSAADANDLSGLADDNDLSNLAGEEIDQPAPAPVPAAEPLPPPVAPMPPAEPAVPFTPPAEPLPLAPPVVPPVFEPVAPPPAMPVEPVPPPPVPVVEPVRPLPAPPPSPSILPAASPSPAPQPVARIESFGGIVTAPMQSALQDLLPEDLKFGGGSATIEVIDRGQVEKDAQISAQVARYIGKERREALDQEIERLYNEVAENLSDNKEDSAYALKVLSEAQNYVLEDIRQYDEALYRVAVVKTMLIRKQHLLRWSYTWGMFVFFYAMAWLVMFITGYLVTGNLESIMNATVETSQGFIAVRAAWSSALAGGIGGVIGILYSLYWHVSMKQDFDRQYVMYYLVQPMMGFVLGAVVFMIISAGFLFIKTENASGNQTIIYLQILLGFIAGFRQRVVFEMIDRLVQKISPQEKDKSPVSVVPEQ